MSRSEARLVAWFSLIVAVLALAASVTLPGTQTWLCRNGVRFACETGKAKIVSMILRHQRIPRSADATMLRDVLASRLSFSGELPAVTPCEDADEMLGLYEARFKKDGGATGLQRGVEDHVLAEIVLAYPSPDVAIDIDVILTMHLPRRDEGVAGFSLEAQPVRQLVKLRSPATADECKASFLLALGKELDALATSGWPAGMYTVDVDVRGGADARGKVEFTLP